MRKLSFLAVALLMTASLLGCRNYDVVGSGPLTLSLYAQKQFKGYLKKRTPERFVISTNGNHSSFVYCSYARCDTADELARAVQVCERVSKTSCFVYARRKSVVWDGEITLRE